MKIITLANEKGGVGKTTLAVHLAAGLAIRGQRVVLIDADAQANATLALGCPEQPGLYDLLIRDGTFSEKLRRIPPATFAPDGKAQGELLLLPGNVESRFIADQLPEANAVLERLQELDGWAEAVVIDTSPTPSLFHGAIYAATDYIVHPVICENLAITGLEKSMKRVKSATTARQGLGAPPIHTLGIVPTMHRDTVLHRENLAYLRENYGALVRQAMPLRIAWSEAGQMGQTVFAYNRNGAAGDAWSFIDGVMAYANES